MPQERELLAFAEAAVAQPPDAESLDGARKALLDQLGPAAVADTAAVIASFNAIVRVADATGLTLEPEKAARTEAIRKELAPLIYPP